jgi:hypothetical protein
MKFDSFKIVDKSVSYLILKQLPPETSDKNFDSLIIQINLRGSYVSNYSLGDIVSLEINKNANGKWIVRRTGDHAEDKRIFEMLFTDGTFIRFNHTYIIGIENQRESFYDELIAFSSRDHVKIMIKKAEQYSKIHFQSYAETKKQYSAPIGDIIGSQ